MKAVYPTDFYLRPNAAIGLVAGLSARTWPSVSSFWNQFRSAESDLREESHQLVDFLPINCLSDRTMNPAKRPSSRSHVYAIQPCLDTRGGFCYRAAL
jgi:hypothetical protein